MRQTLIVFSLLFFFIVPSYAEPIKFGLTLGLTGKYSEMSQMQVKGFRLWERDVNSRGGILGREVRVIIYDDRSDPETAKSLYGHLILKDKVDLVFGPYSSEITEAVLPVTERHGYPVLTSGASSDRLWQKGYKYVFGIYAPASRYSVGFLELLVVNGLNDIAIVYADDSFSEDIAAGTKKWAERFGLRMVLFEGFRKGTKNLDEIAKRAVASKAEVLIVCGHFEEAVNMRLSLKNIKWHPKAYYASVGPAMQAFNDTLKTDAEHVFSSSQWEHHGGLTPPGCHEFYDSFLRAYKTEPSYHAAEAYAAGQLIEAAIKRTGSLNRERIRDMLSAMDEMSIVGRYSVDRTGMQTKHQNLIIQWQKGKKEVVWPDETRTARPVFR
ncbi:MAG: amino acid ABC transporter substrate-binding protein [Thermodesulfovibrionales bacterium]